MCIQDLSKHLAEFHMCSLEEAVDEIPQKLPDEKKAHGVPGISHYFNQNSFAFMFYILVFHLGTEFFNIFK